MEELSSNDPLSREEEAELARTIEAGRIAAVILASDASPEAASDLQGDVRRGLEARARFLASNQGLAHSLVRRNLKRLAASGLTYDELVKAANTGLESAIDRFDWRRGIKFSTFAYRPVGWALDRAVRSAKAKEKRARKSALEEERARTRVAQVLAEEAEAARHRPAVHELANRILDARDAAILIRRMGLDGMPGKSLRAVGSEFGLSGQGIANIARRSVSRLLASGSLSSETAVWLQQHD